MHRIVLNRPTVFDKIFSEIYNMTTIWPVVIHTNSSVETNYKAETYYILALFGVKNLYKNCVSKGIHIKK